MDRIRIGKDILVKWSILTNGEVTSLEGRNLTLVLTTPSRAKKDVEFTSAGNLLMFRFRGIDQKELGVYGLTLWENKDEIQQTAVDACRAFELIPTTCGEVSDGLVTEEITLETSVLNVGIGGASAYEIAVAYGFEGTEEEWLDSLAFKYEDFTEEQLEDIKKPALDAAEVANTAAESANSAAQLANTNAENAQQQANLAAENAALAAEKANEAATQAAYAKEQGDLAAQRGGVGKIDTESDGTGEVFNDYTNNRATGSYSTSKGHSTKSSGAGSVSEGYVRHGKIEAQGDSSYAMGYAGTESDFGEITASGLCARAIGYVFNGVIRASERCSFAMGDASPGSIWAKNIASFAFGYSLDTVNVISGGIGSIAMGVGVDASSYGQMAVGCCNEIDKSASPDSFNIEKPAFVIGNGVPQTSRSNSFKVLFNGQTFADGEYSSAGADYAEMFEWKDGNPSNEDRVGRFVTLKGKHIEIADETSTYVLGIVSGAPTIIGDNPMRWHGKYANDEWGRPIYEDVEVTYTEHEKQEDGTFKQVEKTRIDHVRKLNPLYNAEETYISRAERKEWSFIGMIGKLLVRQDGTLTEGGFCKPSTNGVATISDIGYYVMEVISESQALILFR